MTLEILDTAGQDDYQTMLDSWINNSEAFILVYAIDDRESFEVVQRRYERIIKNKVGQKPPVIVAANKCDLEGRRVVNKQEGEDLAKSWDVNFLEVSALLKINVTETFLSVAKKLLQKKMNVGKGGETSGEVKNRCFCF